MQSTHNRGWGAAMHGEDVIDRLEQGLRAIIVRWGLSAETRLTLLAISENVTFRAEDPQTGRDIVFRVHRPGYHSLSEIASELAWLAALRKDAVIDTLTPVLQTDGGLIADIDDDGTPRHVVAFKFLPGREPDEGTDLTAWFRELGAINARLHAHSRFWTRPRGFVRKTWNFDTTLGDNPCWGDWRDALGLTPDGRQVLEETARLLRQHLDAYGETAATFGLIHADLRLTNLLIDADRLQVIDFDDCGFGWYLYDFAAAISFLEHEPFVPDLLDAWVAGYRSVAPLTDEEVAIIPVFIMLRRILLTAWIASHPETPTAQQLGEEYTHGTVALARAFLAEHDEAIAGEAAGDSGFFS
jgi:Ser/Thr protein kinase RdoA (MazF antagonist)